MGYVYLNSFGCFLPGEPVSNQHMESFLGVVGGKPSAYKNLVLRQNRIKTRHYALTAEGAPFTSSSAMAAQAIHDAVRKSEISLNDITFLAAASTLGDQLVPGLASQVHAALAIPSLELANLQSVCASSLMALKNAYLQVLAGEHETAAVCGSEFASRYFRPHFYEETEAFKTNGEISFNADFLRFTLSDGAGAAILEAKPNRNQPSLKIQWIHLRSFADRFDNCMTAGISTDMAAPRYWSEQPLQQSIAQGMFVLQQDFALMKQMLPVWVSHYMSLIDAGKIVPDGIDHVVSHYSSHSLREEVIALLKAAGAMIDEEKWFSNLASKGNTGAASIFILLEELYHSGAIRPGHKILCHVPESGRAMNGFMLLEAV